MSIIVECWFVSPNVSLRTSHISYMETVVSYTRFLFHYLSSICSPETHLVKVSFHTPIISVKMSLVDLWFIPNDWHMKWVLVDLYHLSEKLRHYLKPYLKWSLDYSIGKGYLFICEAACSLRLYFMYCTKVNIYQKNDEIIWQIKCHFVLKSLIY